MAQLIDKDALVAEIESKIKEWRLASSSEAKFRIEVYKELSEWLDTLEVKEVDLESEWVKYFENRGDMATVNIKHLAKHFFELGMAVNNPTTVADRDEPYVMGKTGKFTTTTK